jgi:hypothetical protein
MTSFAAKLDCGMTFRGYVSLPARLLYGVTSIYHTLLSRPLPTKTTAYPISRYVNLFPRTHGTLKDPFYKLFLV